MMGPFLAHTLAGAMDGFETEKRNFFSRALPLRGLGNMENGPGITTITMHLIYFDIFPVSTWMRSGLFDIEGNARFTS